MKKLLIMAIVGISMVIGTSLFGVELYENVKITGIISYEEGSTIAHQTLILRLSNGECVYILKENWVTISAAMLAFSKKNTVTVHYHEESIDIWISKLFGDSKDITCNKVHRIDVVN